METSGVFIMKLIYCRQYCGVISEKHIKSIKLELDVNVNDFLALIGDVGAEEMSCFM